MYSFLRLKVRPPQLGSCKAIKNDGPSSLVLGNHGILSGFLRKLNFSRASPLALSVLNSTREGTTCGKMLSVLSKTKVSTPLVRVPTGIFNPAIATIPRSRISKDYYQLIPFYIVYFCRSHKLAKAMINAYGGIVLWSCYYFALQLAVWVLIYANARHGVQMFS